MKKKQLFLLKFQDFLDLEYYLTNDQIYELTVDKNYSVVISKHTWKHRMEELMEILIKERILTETTMSKSESARVDKQTTSFYLQSFFYNS